MNSQLKTVHLSNIATLYDSLHKTPKYSEDIYSVVRVTDIKRGYLDLSETKTVNKDTYNEFTKKYKPLIGDIIYSRVGSYGNSSYVNKNERFCLGQNTVCISPNHKLIDSFYLYVCLNSPVLKNQVESLVGGASQPTISLQSINTLQIPYPDLVIQRKISRILKAYDDLIENNTRRIKILEEMAQMLYREWFVNFRFPNHENVKMVESELGLIPEGWKLLKISDIAEVGRGSSPRPIANKKYFEGGTIPWIKIADATKSGKYLYETKEKVNEYGASFSRLLPRGSIIVAASGTLGYTQILGVEGCIHDGWLYLTNLKNIQREYLYFVLIDKQQFFYNSAYGAAIQNVNTTILREMNILLPSLEIQEQFSKIITETDKLIDNLGRKNINLRKTRDLLLPKLISGEIDVENLDIETVGVAALGDPP